MSRLTLLPALDTDLLARCLQVRRAVFVLEKGVPESLEVDDSDRLGTSCLHFLIQVDGADAGALRCQSDGSSAVRIQRLCMKARYRGGGWGKAALAEVERHCLANGADRIVLDAKFDVCGFYEACGYRRVSSVFLEANVPHVRMEKALTI
ncbi:MAG TPA: GNAT family N-acetyltransferase [Candidatus Enterenecus merdae]|nr:GNAT family N-acetyltransferase [Candidatus Enterenecus merdae]